MPLEIAHVVAEYAGLAQTGGLADAVAALTKQMARLGHDVRIFMPRYADLCEDSLELRAVDGMDECTVTFGGTGYRFSILRSQAPDSEATLYLIDCPELYDRPGIYGDGADEHRRFALLARAALEGCQRLSWAPCVFHCHDWHAGLLPLYLKTAYSWDPLLSDARSVLTIHNLAYQGMFAPSLAAELSAESAQFVLYPSAGEQRSVNFLATGIRLSDAVTTVSPTYAREILTPEHGMGLDAALRGRADEPIGILNGVDYDHWNPATDDLIARPYSPADMAGKAVCRERLLADHSLAPDPGGPVLGIVSRLAHQKGLELVLDEMPELLETSDVRLVVLGTGEAGYESSFEELERRFPDQVAFRCTFDLALAHQIEAGCDVFLMPSRFEPCGLNQMYSLKYGTVPLVHRTGGLADTVEPFDSTAGTGTGFSFSPFAGRAFRAELERAVALFADAGAWRLLVANGMSVDYSWPRQAEIYLDTYRELLP